MVLTVLIVWHVLLEEKVLWKLVIYALKMMIAKPWQMSGPVQMSAHEADDCELSCRASQRKKSRL